MLSKNTLIFLSEHIRMLSPWLNKMGQATISIPNEDNPSLRNHVQIKSGAFKEWFHQRALLAGGPLLPTEAITYVVDRLSNKAEIAGTKETGVRIIRRTKVAYLDLMQGNGSVVEIDADGWRIIPCPIDVRFTTNLGARALPTPTLPGSLSSITDLKEFVNLSGPEDFHLVVAWLMGCFMGSEVPILVMNGQHNSGKSTNTNIIRSVVDPVEGFDLMTKPTTERDLISDVACHFVMAYDNITRIEEWMSNILCCLSTGGSFGGRRLYTDFASTRFQATRPVILNGIPEFVKLDDLKRRMFHIHVPPMLSGQRAKEMIYEGFAEAHSHILGCLLDGVVKAFQERTKEGPTLKKALPLRDPIVWANSASETLGLGKDAIINTICEGHVGNLSESFDNNFVGQAVMAFMKDKNEWTGKSRDLLKELFLHAPVNAGKDNWPQHPNGLTFNLERSAESLRHQGLFYDRVRKGSKGYVAILRWIEEPGIELPSSDDITQKDLRV